jgi:hemerythrin superfamily protein
MTDPSTDVTAVIAPQHEQVKQILQLVTERRGEARQTAFHQLRLTLALHETAEEQAIHPHVKQQLRGGDAAATDRVAEEKGAGKAIAELERLDLDSDEFTSKFTVLASRVIEHAAAEETYEWPVLREIADRAVIQTMIDQMSAVPELADDSSAPGPDASFKEMEEWAQAHIPKPPSQ